MVERRLGWRGAPTRALRVREHLPPGHSIIAPGITWACCMLGPSPYAWPCRSRTAAPTTRTSAFISAGVCKACMQEAVVQARNGKDPHAATSKRACRALCIAIHRPPSSGHIQRKAPRQLPSTGHIQRSNVVPGVALAGSQTTL